MRAPWSTWQEVAAPVRKTAAAAFLIAILLGSGGACHRRPSGAGAVSRPHVGVGAIEVQDVTADRSTAVPLATDPIAAVIRQKLLGSGLFAPQAADGGATASGAVVRARANVGIEFTEVRDRGVVRTGVSVKLDTRPSDAPGAVEEELSAAGEQEYVVGRASDRAALAQRLAERTVGDLLGGFAARVHLRVATPAEIHAAIAAGDGGASNGLREEAIRMAGVRGMRAEVPVLLPLLQDENEAVRDAALGALIALRERRAVTELTRNRSLRDRHEMRKILDAIAVLGGDEARDYLSFVAESHEDEEIRKLAAEAKDRLERRRSP